MPAPAARSHLDARALAKTGALELRARQVVEGLQSGQHKSPFQGSSVEFAQHRAYAPGDDVRHVDWKNYARSDRLYIKQFREETNLPLVLLVDASESMGFGSVGVEGGGSGAGGKTWTKYDHAVTAAAALAHLASKQGDAVGLAVFDQQLARWVKPSTSGYQWRHLVSELEGIPRWNKTDFAAVAAQLAEKLQHRSVVAVVSDFLEDLGAVTRGLRLLRHRRHEVFALQVLDDAELRFPYEDVTMFKGLEGLGELLAEPRALRDAYLEQVRHHTDELRRACRALRVDFAQLDTGQPLDVQLSAFLATRAASIRG